MKAEFVETYTKLGMKIAMVRNAKNLSQKEVGEKIGTDSYYISKIERAVVGLSMDKFFAVAQALGVPPKELLDFDDIEKFM